MNCILKNICQVAIKTCHASNFHSSTSALAWSKATHPTSFLENNKKMYPPQEIGEEPRPAVAIKTCHASNFHSSTSALAWSKATHPTSFLENNKKMYPPQEIGEEPRPAFVCHQKTNIKYSPEKMWYIACLVRGMSVDEALKQLSYVNKKGAGFVKDAILEAQELAVKQHHVEFRSNLWVAESFTGKGMVIKGIRKHARGRMGSVRYQFCHYFVRLEEGKPPKDYYKHNPFTPQQQLDKWLESMRKRKIINSY